MDKGIYTLDRFEGEYAVLIGDGMDKLDVIRENLPDNINEGDIVRFDGESFIIDEELSRKRMNDLRSRFERLKKKKRDSGTNKDNL